MADIPVLNRAGMAHLRMAVTMWEYHHLQIHNLKKSFRGEWKDRDEILAILGREGWELVSVLADQREAWEAFFFKRPLEA